MSEGTVSGRDVIWIEPAREDLRAFPEAVKDAMGYALYRAQLGETPASAKPLRGFGGASVLEIVRDHDGDTYRAVYTVRFETAVYVLHVFQKKSTRGIATPKREIDLIRARLARAAEIEAERLVAREGA